MSKAINPPVKTEEIAIKVESVNKTFKLPHEKQSSIKGLFVNMFRRNRTYEKQHVLKDVSFEIKKGEFFGIVGRNGSGKSTLLKLLAGTYVTDDGDVIVNGRLTPFIELGVGFNPELTGRENVFLNGALLGFNRKEMDTMYGDIVSFAELGKFMDQKLKNYSSGMQVRLAFSIAIRANTDILLLDEVLAVGDEAFQRKCYEYFAKIKKEKKTVVFVSHDMEAVKSFCDRAALINKGQVEAIGKSSEIAALYSRLNSAEDPSQVDKSSVSRWGSGEVIINNITAAVAGKRKASFYRDEPIQIRFEIDAVKDVKDVVIGFVIQNAFGATVFATNTQVSETRIDNMKSKKKYVATFSLPHNLFTNGEYTLSGAVANLSRTRIYSRVEDISKFRVSGWQMAHSLVHPSYEFRLEEKNR